MNSSLSDAIKAVDHLNSWVRSKSYLEGLENSKHAIYWLKRCAVEAAFAEPLPLAYRSVCSTVRCNDCYGSGMFENDWGDRYDHCYKCNSSGQTRLKFVETQFDIGRIVTWHTPEYKFPINGLDLGEDQYTNWQPNSIGKDLEPHQVANYLNMAEAYFTKRPKPRWLRDGYRCNDFNYRLFIGSTDPRRCSICNKYAEHRGYHLTRGRIAWCDYACEDCQNQFANNSISIFEMFPFPEYLINYASIKEWIEKHSVISKAGV